MRNLRNSTTAKDLDEESVKDEEITTKRRSKRTKTANTKNDKKSRASLEESQKQDETTATKRKSKRTKVNESTSMNETKLEESQQDLEIINKRKINKRSKKISESTSSDNETKQDDEQINETISTKAKSKRSKKMKAELITSDNETKQDDEQINETKQDDEQINETISTKSKNKRSKKKKPELMTSDNETKQEDAEEEDETLTKTVTKKRKRTKSANNKNNKKATPTNKLSNKENKDDCEQQRSSIEQEDESNDDWDITIMRKIFYAAQQIQKNQKCIQSLYKLMKESNFDEFYSEFCRNVKCVLKYDYENPKVKNILDMISAFMISVKNENLLKNKSNEDTYDEIGLELFGKDTFALAQISKTYKNLLDYIMNDALIPYLGALSTSTRLNTLYLVRTLLKRAEDIEFNIYERLKSVLIDRITDKNVNVRVSASHTLFRFQAIEDPDCSVIAALKYHLKHDNAPTVRIACLNVIFPTKEVIPDLILKTRDVNAKIRETAFKKLAKRINFKQLTVNNRLTLLKNGFKDRNEKVNLAVKNSLVPAWLKSYDDDIIELLTDLEVIDNVDIISKFLEFVFQYSFTIKVEKRTRLHFIVDKFYEEYLDEQAILNKKQLSPENCLFWRCLSNFLKKNEDNLLKYQPDLENRLNLRNEINSLLEAIDLKDTEETNPILNSTEHQVNNEECNKTDQNNSINNQDNLKLNNHSQILTEPSLIENEDDDLIKNPIDLIIPNLSNFIAFFKDFCYQVNSGEFESEQLLLNEFIFKEFCLFLENYEIDDDSQKHQIITFSNEIILLDQLGDKFEEYIECLMKYLSKSVIKTNEELVEYTVDITNKVEATLENEPEEEELPIVDPKEIRKLELSYARKTICLNDAKDKLDEALVTKKYDAAHTFKQEIEKYEGEINDIKYEINRMKNISIRQKSEIEFEYDIKDHPSIHVKLLQIFGSCLRFGTFKNLTSMMDTRITNYILPGFLSTDSRIRYYALKALNYAIYLSSTLASRYCPLYHEICTKDNQQIQVCALQGLIDALVEHGLYILYPDTDDDVNQQHQQSQTEYSNIDQQQQSNDDNQEGKKSNANSLFTATREFTKASSFLNSSEIKTPDTSLMDDDIDLHRNTNNESDLDKDDNEDDEDNELNERQADLTLKSQIIDPNKTALQIEKEDEILKQLTKFLLKFIRSDVEEIKSTAVMGICKLLVLGRIYSPLLLSELILLWYNSSTSLPIQHDIGTFLPIYCLAGSTFQIQIPENFSGQYCLLECFMSTVENVYRLERGEQLEISIDLMRSNYYDCDIDVLNVIEFMLNLLEPVNHVKIVLEFCEKILEILKIARDDEYELKEPFLTKYLMRSLPSFKLFEATDEQLERLKFLIQEIQSVSRFNQLKKQFTNKVDKFLQQFPSKQDQQNQTTATSSNKTTATVLDKEIEDDDLN